jgi:hypothetical protein
VLEKAIARELNPMLIDAGKCASMLDFIVAKKMMGIVATNTSTQAWEDTEGFVNTASSMIAGTRKDLW